MSAKKVNERVRIGTYGPDGWTTRLVRRKNLPMSYVYVHVGGLTLYAKTSDVSKYTDAVRLRERRYTFPPAVRTVLEAVARPLGPRASSEAADLEHVLRRRTAAWRVVASYQLHAETYTHFAAGLSGDDPATVTARHEILAAVGKVVWEHSVEPITLSAARVAEIEDWVDSDVVQDRFRERAAEFRDLVTAGVVQPDRVTLEALVGTDGELTFDAPFDPDVVIGTARLIVAINNQNGLPFAAFRDLPRTGEEEPGAPRVEMLGSTDLPAEWGRADCTFPPGTVWAELDEEELLELSTVIWGSRVPLSLLKMSW